MYNSTHQVLTMHVSPSGEVNELNKNAVEPCRSVAELEHNGECVFVLFG
jgi:hypothetical protein